MQPPDRVEHITVEPLDDGAYAGVILELEELAFGRERNHEVDVEEERVNAV